MDNKNDEDFTEFPSTDVFEIPGEPAIVVNGLPPLSSTDANLIPCPITNSKPRPLAGFGAWLQGREVRKLFGDQFFNGRVSEFDQEMEWFRVLYEDGDCEDLEWHELMEVLVPLDINIPLRTLTMKIIKKRQKSLKKSAKIKVRSRKNSSYDDKGKEKLSGGS
ncbi:hypothetical protein CDL12_12364 [Handroanthus impetiginosus]|uniref:PTM/DIR17-like Tudor domain-containing protein n=1 Tax=Handroanthus impetiginosus TaxID=429701 RepID=A0A2G9HC13_9LAMI|nr:hypothetical protein CDL12_12364 [Handroanthus impetiginosus]